MSNVTELDNLVYIYAIIIIVSSALYIYYRYCGSKNTEKVLSGSQILLNLLVLQFMIRIIRILSGLS